MLAWGLRMGGWCFPCEQTREINRIYTNKEDRLEIQSLFDAQIEGVMKQTTEQLNWLKENGMPDQVVCYTLLTLCCEI